jgi:hypothetical protein
LKPGAFKLWVNCIRRVQPHRGVVLVANVRHDVVQPLPHRPQLARARGRVAPKPLPDGRQPRPHLAVVVRRLELPRRRLAVAVQVAFVKSKL